MFIHNFKYAFKTLFRKRSLVFWTFAFPIILGTLFYFAFSDIEKEEQLDVIDIAVVEEEEFSYKEVYKKTFAALGDAKSDTQLFNIQYVDLDQAKKLLADQKIVGYVLLQKDPLVVVKESGINETILKYVLEEITQTGSMMQDIMESEVKKSLGAFKDKEPLESMDTISIKVYQDVVEKAFENDEKHYLKDTTSSHLSYTMIEFYTLIAMTCLYGGLLGMTALHSCLASMSATGKRIEVSPTSKGRLILSSVLASYLVQLLGITILFLYTIFVLHVDYGTHFFFIVLLTLFGSFAGLSFGIFSSSVIKTSENTKTGIVIALTMLGCFLSGMMGITMKYVVDKNIPILNRINPANLITDGFYALYYYDTFERFYLDLASLILFSVVLLLLSGICLRRQKYDAI